MNRVNIVYLFAVLWLLVSPSLTAPADNEAAKQENGSPEIEQEPPNASRNEIAGDIGRDDVESFKPENGSSETDDDTLSFTGISTGIISRSGINGTFECKKITCPDLTQTCKYTSKFSPDGKTADVHYQCFSSDGTVLWETTEPEDASDDGIMSIEGFFSDFTRRMNTFLDDILRSFRY